MRRALRALWGEPAVPDPPARVWRDWVLFAVVVALATVEGIVRVDVTWRPVAIVACVLLSLTLLQRRTHPLGAVLVFFGTATVLELLARSSGTPPFGLYTMAVGLVLPYALVRWASGRDIVLGLAFVLVTQSIRSVAIDRPTDLVAGIAFFSAAAALGLAVRVQARSRERRLDQVRSAEREQLARELHDTVAHHVSAMVVRAQAGRVVGRTDPAAAMDALAVIEAEGARTLAEMRVLVGALRDDDAPLLAPRTAADLATLARDGDGLAVEVHVIGDPAGLHPAVGTALFRIAQESVTNATRHAVRATRVVVALDAQSDPVVLTVTDDGEPPAGDGPDAGYGLVGMAERVTLLGGSLTAGPRPDRGWTVQARVPRTGVAS